MSGEFLFLFYYCRWCQQGGIRCVRFGKSVKGKKEHFHYYAVTHIASSVFVATSLQLLIALQTNDEL